MKALHNRVLISCCNKTHNKCDTTKKASNMMGCKINIFLVLLESAYGTKSRKGIIIEATAVEDDKGYQVCTDV